MAKEQKITVKELSRRIDEYFLSREEQVDDGRKTKKIVLPCTVTGLALALGLESREELYLFKEKEKRRLINRALLRIEEYAEERLFSKEGFSGIKMYLITNFERWQDKNEGETDAGIPDSVSKWAN